MSWYHDRFSSQGTEWLVYEILNPCVLCHKSLIIVIQQLNPSSVFSSRVSSHMAGPRHSNSFPTSTYYLLTLVDISRESISLRKQINVRVIKILTFFFTSLFFCFGFCHRIKSRSHTEKPIYYHNYKYSEGELAFFIFYYYKYPFKFSFSSTSFLLLSISKNYIQIYSYLNLISTSLYQPHFCLSSLAYIPRPN